MTLVVNFFSGPGTGKSTITALTFGKLKMEGYNVEIAHEYAKELTWEGRSKALSYQPYITGKQMFKVERLLGQVDAVLTDSPILLSHVYGSDSLPTSYYEFLIDTFDTWNTFNIFLERNSALRGYNPKGRNQTEAEAIEIDEKIRTMLEDYRVPYTTVKILPDLMTAEICAELVKEAL